MRAFGVSVRPEPARPLVADRCRLGRAVPCAIARAKCPADGYPLKRVCIPKNFKIAGGDNRSERQNAGQEKSMGFYHI